MKFGVGGGNMENQDPGSDLIPTQFPIPFQFLCTFSSDLPWGPKLIQKLLTFKDLPN